MSNSILLSPHDDDNALFAAFTCMREQPLVVICTDSYIQPMRGELGCSAEERAKESEAACKLLKCPVMRLAIRDYELTDLVLLERLRHLKADRVYAPALQGGNPHHDIVARVAQALFKKELRQYTTYSRSELYTKGGMEIIPADEELELKRSVLNCYESQIKLNATWPHFEAVWDKSEWYL